MPLRCSTKSSLTKYSSISSHKLRKDNSILTAVGVTMQLLLQKKTLPVGALLAPLGGLAHRPSFSKDFPTSVYAPSRPTSCWRDLGEITESGVIKVCVSLGKEGSDQLDYTNIIKNIVTCHSIPYVWGWNHQIIAQWLGSTRSLDVRPAKQPTYAAGHSAYRVY
jgi:hypothetical protein